MPMPANPNNSTICRSQAPAWLRIPKRIEQKARESLAVAKADHLLDRKLGALSGGEQQRVLLSLALDPVPEILLLDEPVSGIDQNGLEMFYELLSDLRKRYDLSIILVSHDMDLVAHHADRLVLLNKTILASGKPREVFESEGFKHVFFSMIGNCLFYIHDIIWKIVLSTIPMPP